ncbi:MAG TPA: hypothetical protein VJ838_14945 [Gaiellaceae bacterium]|nr:hypothetical protein [Gaiellaceae bacterium]
MPSGSTTARVPAKKYGKEYHKGFDAALEQALGQLSKQIGTGSYSVDVRFQLDVEVTNPGKVGYIKVTLDAT